MASIQMHFDPGEAITGRVATGQKVKAGMLVTLAAAKEDGKPVTVKPCDASDYPLGLVDADGAASDLVTIHRVGVGAGIASAAITAGAAVQTAADGELATYSTGIRTGVALTTASADQDPVLFALSI